MAMAFDTLRVGHTYRMKNYDDVREFKVLRRLTDKNFIIQDITTMEKMELEDLVRYGKGKDYDLDEINEHGDIV